jgi:predicted nucleic acid-binding protein
MLLIDTSLWVPIYRDPSGSVARHVQDAIGTEEIVFCQFIRAELLQGCRDDRDWARTLEYLDSQSYLEMSIGSWTEAARIYFELRQRGLTVRSTLDCCIAVVALEHADTAAQRPGLREGRHHPAAETQASHSRAVRAWVSVR